jgi:predicted metalloprotease with PDZ domain
MKPLLSMAFCVVCWVGGVAQASTGPTAIMPDTRIALPKDRPYPGELHLAVDASDLERKIVTVHEQVSGISGETVLLYPEWLPGHHSPSGPIDRIAGIRISANGTSIPWTRDPVNVYAFHVHAPAGVKSIDIEFQYLSPTSMKVGRPEMSRDVLLVEWNETVLYPAGYFTRQIPVAASLTLPADWKFGSALEVASTSGARTEFKTTPLETLVDSPLYAGRYSQRLDLDPNAAVAVNMDVFADRPELLVVKPEQLEIYRALVQQAYKLFGSHHYSHYDFLYSLSDQVEQNGLEHHQSSEDGANPEAFVEWNKYASGRDLLSHEYTHSWNGKFRRPADLWTPNYNVPMQDSLLWVYEGQTQYWGEVLAGRSGLWTKQQTLDQLALTAAYFEIQSGRRWRALEDTTKDPIINPRRPMPWRDWQRFEDYYPEAAMIWLDADTLIREKSDGKRSLDDFAKAFFGINNGSFVPVTYTFDDVVKALNAVQPNDWAAFLHARLDGVGQPPFEDGIKRGGYKVVYVDTPSDFQKSVDDSRKRVSLTFSIGVDLDAKESTLSNVIWDSPAFKAKLTEGTQILAVNGAAYSAEILKDAIRAAKGNSAPIELIVKNGERYRVVSLNYHDGLRYPRLERDAATPARLDDIIAARK